MIIKKQSLEEMKQIYDGMMKRHFPADEIKPFKVIEKGYLADRYMGYGLYEEENPDVCLAYAWMCWMKEENWMLLDYYAVREELRGQGLGSHFLRDIVELYTQNMPVIIEVEDPDRIEELKGEEASESIGELKGEETSDHIGGSADVNDADREDWLRMEREKRLRRIAFYLKNGIRMTDMRATVYHVPYAIMVFQKDFSFDFDRESLKRAYHIFYAHIPEHVEIG